jgi:hypothetical protein
VVKGLILDRLQKLSTQRAVLASRIARQSLGVICNERYDPADEVHKQARLIKDEIDGRLYAQNRIRWFVKQVRLSSV